MNLRFLWREFINVLALLCMVRFAKGCSMTFQWHVLAKMIKWYLEIKYRYFLSTLCQKCWEKWLKTNILLYSCISNNQTCPFILFKIKNPLYHHSFYLCILWILCMFMLYLFIWAYLAIRDLRVSDLAKLQHKKTKTFGEIESVNKAFLFWYWLQPKKYFF